MEASSVVKIAKYKIHAYRLFLRVFRGKKRRDRLVIKNKMSYIDFLPIFYGNETIQGPECFKGVPRKF